MDASEHACFVNTKQNPIKIKRLGLLEYSESNGRFRELCEVWYPHPDAPSVAKVSIFMFMPVKFSGVNLRINAVNVIERMGELSQAMELDVGAAEFPQNP